MKSGSIHPSNEDLYGDVDRDDIHNSQQHVRQVSVLSPSEVNDNKANNFSLSIDRAIAQNISMQRPLTTKILTGSMNS